MLLTVAGILGAVLFLIGDYSYFVDTLKGETKPQRVTWGVAFLLNSIGFANQYASGASNSLWLFAAAVIATGAIFIASIFRGVGGHSKLDILAVTIAILGVALWAVFDSPLMSILSMLVVVAFSVTPTIIKAKKHPESETRIAWLFGSISSLLAAVSVGELNLALLILPINGVFLQGYIAYVLYFGANKRHRGITETPVHSPAEPLEP
jgi:hypothetical protein